MKTETIVMCVVALILGMLLANMLQNVCGCKVVEGQYEYEYPFPDGTFDGGLCNDAFYDGGVAGTDINPVHVDAFCVANEGRNECYFADPAVQTAALVACQAEGGNGRYYSDEHERYCTNFKTHITTQLQGCNTNSNINPNDNATNATINVLQPATAAANAAAAANAQQPATASAAAAGAAAAAAAATASTDSNVFPSNAAPAVVPSSTIPTPPQPPPPPTQSPAYTFCDCVTGARFAGPRAAAAGCAWLGGSQEDANRCLQLSAGG